MPAPRAELVVVGDIVTAAGAHGLEVVQAIGIAGGRIVSAGSRADVTAAASNARIIDATGHAVTPGLHDSHVHLIDLARSRRSLDLVPAHSFADLLALVRERHAALPRQEWLRGRGWSAESLPADGAAALLDLLGSRPAFLGSRDGHSAWASSAVLERAGIGAGSDDPRGGRIERDAHGVPNGIVRETAVDLVRPFVERLGGDPLRAALDDAVAELSALGITGATDAGDFTAEGGQGEYAALGDSFSALAGASGVLAGRLRVTANVPRLGLGAAIERKLTTGATVEDAGDLRVGWVKAFADGALGSRTAALFEPYSCDADGLGTGLMTLAPDELADVISSARGAGIAVAIHAIGDRANAAVVDAYESAGRSAGAFHDRIEHAQLTRPVERSRMAALAIVASVQPVHCPADAEAVDRCWAGREAHAYAFRSLASAGVELAFGSDAPVEPVDPWRGVHAAVNRRHPGAMETWQPHEALSLAEALAGYTSGPASALGRAGQGSLRIGAHADLAVLSCSLDTLREADDRLLDVVSEMTMVGGREIPRGEPRARA